MILNDRYLFRGKRDNGEWVVGYLFRSIGCRNGIETEAFFVGEHLDFYYEIDPATVSQCTGLRVKVLEESLEEAQAAKEAALEREAGLDIMYTNAYSAAETYKRRVAALEKALRQYYPCPTCKYSGRGSCGEPCDDCTTTTDHNRWEFNYERFAPPATEPSTAHKVKPRRVRMGRHDPDCQEDRPNCLCNTCVNDDGFCCDKQLEGCDTDSGGLGRCPDYIAEPTCCDVCGECD